MSFISLEFVIFFAVIIPLYFAVPQRWRWAYLLVAGYVFYANASIVYALVLLLSTLVDYALARAIAHSDSPSRRRNFLLLSVAINLGVLGFFKYFNFFNDSLASLFDGLGIDYTVGALNIALPLGISFYTFTKLAYVIDVYRGTIQPEKHVGRFAAFVAFFPNLTSGPIERAAHLLPQFEQNVTFDESRVVEGLRRILWGAFKKVVIADTLAVYVDAVYGQPDQHTGPVLILATLFLAFQIYADFSGYVDIALGTAKILGIELFENFRQPYFATSILDFWRRWHMSLTSWIRDYMFMPLSRQLLRKNHGRVSPRVIQAASYLIIMTLIGLWHGAAWTFVIWGLLHGAYMGIEMLLPRRILVAKTRPGTLVRVGVTFVLVSFAWIFFRASSVSDALYVVSHLFNFAASGSGALVAPFETAALSGEVMLALAVGLIAFLIAVDLADARWELRGVVNRCPVIIRWAWYYGATAITLLALVLATQTQRFIYFQF